MTSPQAPQNQDVKILVVEDSATQALVLQHLLEERGYKVGVAASGSEAIESMSEARPDLIISDIVMPGMSGFELCNIIKQDPNRVSIPVILLTALSDPEDVIKGLSAKVDYYLTKPYDHDFLIKKIESIVENGLRSNVTQSEVTCNLNLWGKQHTLEIDPEQALSLLASTYENAIEISKKLRIEIAQRQKAENELKTAMKKLREMQSIVEISPAVAVVRRAVEDWPVEFVSDNVLQFDYEAEDLLSGAIKFLEMIHPDDRDRVMSEAMNYSQDPDVEEYFLEYRILTGYGATRWVDDRTFIRRDGKGRVTHYQGILLDITHRKEE
jgi:PAS domain S-box-containing protein